MHREHLGRLGAVLLGATIGLLLSGCGGNEDAIYQDPRYNWLKPIADDLDPVARGLDEYGTISMSTPLLSEPDASFAFNLNRSGTDYYNDARKDINGAATTSSQQSSVNSSGATAQLDVQQLVQEGVAAATGGATALLAAAKGPTTLPAISVNVLPTTQPATSPLSDKFTAAMGLLTGPAPVMENRAAIITAAGDVATQAMLKYLAGPSAAMKFKDKKVLFGVSMVSVRPGSRTATGYDASVAQTFIFEYWPLRESLRRTIDQDAKLRERIESGAVDRYDPRFTTPRSPLVAAVSPMSETQTLDLQNSLRNRQRDAAKFALALSGFGAGIQAQSFNDLVKQLESDISTISNLNVVSSFAHGANICGFSVTPRLRALADPANQDGKNNAAMVLDPVSFPALILVGIDAEDLRILAVRVPNGAGPTSGPAATPEETAGNRFEFYEPVLKCYQSTHWTPLTDPKSGERLGEPLTETRRLAWAAHLERAERALRCHNDPNCRAMTFGGPADAAATDPVPDYLKVTMNALGSQAIHTYDWQNIPQTLLLAASGDEPPKPVPQIEQMTAADLESAAAGANGTPQPVWLVGTGFDSVDLSSIAPILPQGADPANLPKVSVTGPALLGQGAKAGARQAITFSVSASGGKGHVPVAFSMNYRDTSDNPLILLTPPIDVFTADKPTPKSVTIIRTFDRKDGSQSETLTFPADAPPAAVQNFLAVPTTRPSGGAREVDVNVRAREAGR